MLRIGIGLCCAVILLALGGMVFYQAISRYVDLLPPILWTEEVSRGLLIWLVMIGAGWAAFENTHFRLSIFENLLGRTFHMIGCLATVASGSYITYSGLLFAERGMSRISQVSGLPAVWVYSAILIAGVFVLCGGIYQTWRLIIRSTSGKY